MAGNVEINNHFHIGGGRNWRRQQLNDSSDVEKSEEIVQSFNSDKLKRLDGEDGIPPRVETVSPDVKRVWINQNNSYIIDVK